MKYIKRIFISLLEPLTIMAIQYIILIITIILLGINKSIIWGTILLMIFEIGYIVHKWPKSSKKSNLNNLPYFPYMLLGVGIATMFNMIVCYLGIINITENNISIILIILSSVIIGPIFEEFLFRYSLIEKLAKFNSTKRTIIISSLIFALFHTSWWQMIYAFIIGLINSYFYFKYKYLTIPIIIHISANLITTFLTGYNKWILVLSIILTILSISIISKDNKIFKLKES